MTRFAYIRRDGRCVLRADGHADFCPGRDIVCAGASALVCALAGALDALGAQGHNSAITTDDGRAFLVCHTKFNDGTAGHQVRAHQLFTNSDGWLVASPFRYNGEMVTDADIASAQPFTAAELAGTYKLLIHKYGMDYANYEECPSVIGRYR